jgi:hypothetical protein
LRTTSRRSTTCSSLVAVGCSAGSGPGTRTQRASSATVASGGRATWLRSRSSEPVSSARVPRSRRSTGSTPLQALAAAEAQSASGAAAEALVYLADVVQVSRGGWFETYVGHPGAGATPAPGAIAANIGFVVPTAAGSVAADAAGRPDAFDNGWDAERGCQLAWLTEKLDLDELYAGRHATEFDFKTFRQSEFLIVRPPRYASQAVRPKLISA